MLPIMLKSYIAYSGYSRDPWTSSETHRQNRERVNVQMIQNPYTPRQEEPPAWSMSPGGRKNILLSGDVLWGLGSPGKAMTEKVVASDPGPRGEGHMPQGHAQEGRRKYLPWELRMKLYDEVKRLRRDGLTYSEIIEEIQRMCGVRLSKSHISYWTRGVRSPYNYKIRYISSVELLRPSEELAYVIGVKLGDGYTNHNKVRIGLRVKDREFAIEFGRCLSKVLGRGPIKPGYINYVGLYAVEVQSKVLYEFLKKPVDLNKLKKYVEHCKRCMSAFLRGFTDSEGSVSREGYICVYNTDRKLLEYIKNLLKRLGIESTGPWPKRQQGKPFYDYKTMKTYTYNKDEYYIYIRTGDNMKFYKHVGFTISRKQKRLENYVRKQQTRKH
jgi:intein-encoded DNA endonuclease-like protein